MEMARFHGAQDPGYVAVSSQLWLWCNAIQESRPSVETIREKRNRRFGELHDVAPTVISGGGPVFMGNQTAGRDFNVNAPSR